MSRPLHILVADDHVAIREGIRQILDRSGDIQVAAMVSTLDQLLDALTVKRYDVLLLDLSLGNPRPQDVMAKIRAVAPELPVLVYTMEEEGELAVRLFANGISGYVTKDAAPEILIDAIRRVGNGGRYVSGTLGEILAAAAGRSKRPPHEQLSSRELQVLVMTAEGKSLKEIGVKLGVSLKTVSTYRTRTLQKLGLTTNADLIRYAIVNGLTSR